MRKKKVQCPFCDTDWYHMWKKIMLHGKNYQCSSWDHWRWSYYCDNNILFSNLLVSYNTSFSSYGFLIISLISPINMKDNAHSESGISPFGKWLLQSILSVRCWILIKYLSHRLYTWEHCLINSSIFCAIKYEQ